MATQPASPFPSHSEPLPKGFTFWGPLSFITPICTPSSLHQLPTAGSQAQGRGLSAQSSLLTPGSPKRFFALIPNMETPLVSRPSPQTVHLFLHLLSFSSFPSQSLFLITRGLGNLWPPCDPSLPSPLSHHSGNVGVSRRGQWVSLPGAPRPQQGAEILF